jgi:hypothetical protein
MANPLEPAPVQSALVDRQGSLLRSWAIWITLQLIARIEGLAAAVATVALTAQAAAITSTTLVSGANGLYAVSYRVRVSTAAGTSSAIALTITTTEGGVTCTQASPSYTGNATNAPQSGRFLVRADPGTVIAYSTAYTSVGAPALVYQMDLDVKRIGA